MDEHFDLDLTYITDRIIGKTYFVGLDKFVIYLFSFLVLCLSIRNGLPLSGKDYFTRKSLLVIEYQLLWK